MRQLIAFPALALAVILQSAIVSRITLLSGFADLVLVVVVAWALQEGVTSAWHWSVLAGIATASISGLPWWAPLSGFLAATLLARFVQRRIWQAPLLAMFAVTFFASMFSYFISYAALALMGASMPLTDSFTLVILPSALLNLLFSIPVFWLTRDLSRWVNPVEEEE
ncbi:MAG: hypothetical protein JETCAE02_03830 [Anaerolineaceae bacterium]|jgi:hypothetical protein|nr:hypothetical protein [Anaerolineae bacterium]MBL1172201.1 hypothetical protein [Chloroflexota bacterium]MBV6466789.1 hypothetical protein [Anaerolineales bacterium]MCE7904929.1 hypothetical protein [Anaerolineae bacterium CFX3]MDL1926148.1 hypothetical protein [Anaerolineae bacterium AMX1]OQY86766.1 MAG: hypothetical protein B6D40_00670 [Anaerolineae bacterium UTCFX3]GER81241.1 conserved hypothetical protein [Candidatus Denitrolinea symbiosum]GJQ37971.1 MAG: hypothetical protein JETCAE02_